MTEENQKKPEKPRKLTKKQRGFVKDYVATGNGTLAVMKNYDVESEMTASSIASENLRKPYIASVILEAMPDDFLAGKHKELFEQKQVEYFTFSKSMSDEEIVEHVKASGIDVITVRESDKGKMAFYSIPNAQAIKSGLEMAYRIKGIYETPEPPKEGGNTYNFLFSPETQADIKALEDKIKARLLNKHD